MWPSLEALNVPLIGPGTQNTEDAWENDFYDLIASNNYRVDYASVHEYVPPNAASLISDLESVYNAYGRPVWLTEFSPVDWSGNQGWTEDDDYNFLAEFMWQAESLEWIKRYAIFPFTGTNALPPYQSTTAGYRGNFFLTVLNAFPLWRALRDLGWQSDASGGDALHHPQSGHQFPFDRDQWCQRAAGVHHLRQKCHHRMGFAVFTDTQ